MPNGILYLSYSGMLEPLGQSQVLAYQERLVRDHPVHIVSFERPEDWQDVPRREAVAERMRAAGIAWHPQRYHKRFSVLATLWDITVGIVVGLRLVRRHALGIVHARSYVSSAMALVIKRLTGAKYIFDMRGFWADERVDGGLWPRDGRMYRVAKWFERRFLLNADHVVSLTRAAVRIMQGFDYLQGRMPPMTVIPTCADLSRFRPMPASKTGFVLGYVGSAGTWYLFDAAVASFAALRQLRSDARFLILNRGDHSYIRERLSAGGVPLEVVELRSAGHEEVPAQMARMHAGVFFIKPLFSKQASAPTKLGEFLGCGLPCLSNEGVGDMAEVLSDDRVGIAVDALDSDSLRQGVSDLLGLCNDPGVQQRCVDGAERHFSLRRGVEAYASIYRSLAQS